MMTDWSEPKVNEPEHKLLQNGDIWVKVRLHHEEPTVRGRPLLAGLKIGSPVKRHTQTNPSTFSCSWIRSSV